MIKLSKSNILWSYAAQILSISSGIITLPLILNKLTSDEIGLNYIFISISTLIALFDFGFTPQFSRNFSYVFGGSQEIRKEGIKENIENNSTINYKLLKTLIEAARYLYKRLSIVIFIVLISLGSIYIAKVTHNFTLVKNAHLLWLIYTLSISIDFYFKYYTPLLLGKGLITENKKILIFSLSIKIFTTIVLLIFGFGLWSVIWGGFLSTISIVSLTKKCLIYDGLNVKLKSINVNKTDIEKTFNSLWYNARKLGIVGIATYTSIQLGLFYSGLFLSLSEVASYGLMLQITTLIGTVSNVTFQTSQTIYAMLRAKGENRLLFNEFAFSMGIFYFLYSIGILLMIFIAPYILNVINSSVTLPSFSIMLCFGIFKFLEVNHCNFSVFLTTKNIVYDFESAIIIGISNILGLFLVLKFTGTGILGIVLVQGIIGLAYPNWKWPYEVCKEYKINIFDFVKVSFNELKNRILSSINNV